MDQQVNLTKQVFEKRQYDRTINTSFTQLVSPVTEATGSALPTVDQFFDFYNQLFFDIPKFGELNSHEYLIKTSQEYIGATAVVTDELQALIDEVTELRQANLELNQQVLNLQSSVSNISNIQI
jgi:hypothetical protein